MSQPKSKSPSQTVLVFGGSGFLGSHVADALSDAGYRVKIFDIRKSPYLRSDQEMIVGDLMDRDAVKKATEGATFVYNFAGLADINEAKDRPVETAATNVLGNVHALEAAHEAGVKRFVFASTIYVFSKSGSFYRASKQSGEHFVETFQERYQLNYSILRYGSLYGRRADEHNGIYRLLKQALETKNIHYAGTGEAMREYIHVNDAAKLSVKILGADYENRHVFLAGPERMSIRTLTRMICEMLPGTKATFNEQAAEMHYDISPYTFMPQVGYKLVSDQHVEIGQGLLDCLSEIHEKLNGDTLKRENGLLVK